MAQVLLIRCPFAEAHLARIALERAGLEVELRGVMRSGLFGVEGLEDASSEVWVDEQSVVRARQVLEEASRMLLSTDEWACAKCGEKNPTNFQICWKCQASMKDGSPVEILPPKEDAPRPPGPSRLPMITALLVVAVIGLGVMLVRSLSRPTYVDGPGITVVAENDGCVVKWYHDEKRARWCDRSVTSLPSTAESFDSAGRVVDRATDANDDGIFELFETFDTQGRVVARYRDADNDGRYERVEDLDPGGRIRSLGEDRDGDGRFERLDLNVGGLTHYVYLQRPDGEQTLEVQTAGGTALTFKQTAEGWR